MNYIDILNYLPSELATVIISMLPVIELRGAIPVAYGVYDLSITQAYFWSVLGNMIPAVLLVFLLERVSVFLSKRFKIAKDFFDWIFNRAHKKFVQKHEKYGAAALILFVAIPLPVTGVWTASVAAFLFGIRHRVAIPYMTIGVLIAGIIVSLITVGVL